VFTVSQSSASFIGTGRVFISPGVPFAIPWEIVQTPYPRFPLCLEMELCRREHVQFAHR
jgi:hypothetical protein